MVSKNHRNHSKRLNLALHRLKVYEGVPKKVERTKRMVVPEALRNLRLAPKRDYCTLGRLSHELGWKQQVWILQRCNTSRTHTHTPLSPQAVIAKLEVERKERGAKYFESKKQNDKLWNEAKAEASKALPKQAAILAKFGY